MNPIAHLPEKWEELNRQQKFEVIQSYDEANSYHEFCLPQDNRMSPEEYFENIYYPIDILLDYFKFWKD